VSEAQDRYLAARGIRPLKARELTDAEARELIDAGAHWDRRARAALREGRKAAWAFAEAAYHLEDLQVWRGLGYETLDNWLADPEVGIARSTFRNAVWAWRELVEVRGVSHARLAPIAPTAVYAVLPAITRGNVSPEAALADAEALGRRDLRERYRGRGAFLTERLAAEDEPRRVRCPVCDGWTTEDVIEGKGREMPAPMAGAAADPDGDDDDGPLTPPSDRDIAEDRAEGWRRRGLNVAVVRGGGWVVVER
jgi:hypothetical protein